MIKMERGKRLKQANANDKKWRFNITKLYRPINIQTLID